MWKHQLLCTNCLEWAESAGLSPCTKHCSQSHSCSAVYFLRSENYSTLHPHCKWIMHVLWLKITTDHQYTCCVQWCDTQCSKVVGSQKYWIRVAQNGALRNLMCHICLDLCSGLSNMIWTSFNTVPTNIRMLWSNTVYTVNAGVGKPYADSHHGPIAELIILQVWSLFFTKWPPVLFIWPTVSNISPDDAVKATTGTKN